MTLLNILSAVIIAECLALCVVIIYRMAHAARIWEMMAAIALAWSITAIQIMAMLPEPSYFVRSGIATRIVMILIVAMLIISYQREKHAR
jgi:hypothetical protein